MRVWRVARRKSKRPETARKPRCLRCVAPQAPASGGNAGAGFSVSGEPVGSVATPAA
jgi:hypothetical protein